MKETRNRWRFCRMNHRSRCRVDGSNPREILVLDGVARDGDGPRTDRRKNLQETA